MKDCYYCGRSIACPKRIVDQGIQYVCATEEDKASCSEIVQEKKRLEREKHEEILAKNPIAIRCEHCNHRFLKSEFVIVEVICLETMSEKWLCPSCSACLMTQENLSDDKI